MPPTAPPAPAAKMPRFGGGTSVATRTAVMNAIPEPSISVVAPGRSLGYHGAVCDFKRRLIEATLQQMRGNRTHTARALGLQRTYLLRLIRELGVAAPPPPPRRRAATG
jgi:DNA-binding NtrC family response regulator